MNFVRLILLANKISPRTDQRVFFISRTQEEWLMNEEKVGKNLFVSH